MPNSHLSILPLFNALDMLVSNTANADVTMLTKFVTFTSFFWHLLVSAVAMPLTLTLTRETAPREILTGRLIKVLSIGTLGIPDTMLRPLEQVFSHISQSKSLEYFFCFFYLSSSCSSSCCFP